MIPEIEQQLENDLSIVLQVWQQAYQSSAMVVANMSNDVATNAFLYLISGLNKIKASGLEQAVTSTLLAEEISFFIDLSVDLHTEGYDITQVVHWVKTLRFALEKCIEKCITNDRNKLLETIALHKITDCIETALLTNATPSITQKPIQDQQTTWLKIARSGVTYKNTFELTSNLVLITDEHGAITEVNPAARIFFSGKKPIGSFCGSLLQIATDMENLLGSYAPDKTHEILFHAHGIKRVFNLEIRLLSKSSPLAKGLLLILSDITCTVDHRQMLEQRVVERTRALAKSEKLLDAIFHSIGKGILLLDHEFEIIQANRMASEMYGIPPEVLMGTYYHALTDEQGQETMESIRSTLEEGDVESIECTSIYVDGRQFPSRVTVTSMDLDGEHFWPITIWDITKQKELEADILDQKQHAEEMNVTLKNVLKSIESEKRQFEENLSSRIRSSFLPTIARIGQEPDQDSRTGYLTLLREQLISLTLDFTATPDGDLLKLSKTELKVCQFIKAGLTGKEICEAMNISFETIQTHRKNIRKKLGLRGKDINLHSFLAERVL